jgi:hypothetical protein
MANYCITNYVFTGSKEEIAELYSIFNKKYSDDSNENNWLGNIVAEILDPNYTLYHKGWFWNVKLEDENTLSFETETAWHPCYQLFDFISNRYFLSYYFKGYEPNCGVYVTNDVNKKYFKYGKKYNVIDERDIKGHIAVERYMANFINKDMLYKIVKQLD